MLEVESEESGLAVSGVPECGEHIRCRAWVEEHDGAAFHAGSVSNPRFTSDDDGPGYHVDSREVTDPSADRNQSPSHRVSNFVTGVPVDEDLASCHATMSSAVDGSGQVSDVSVDMDPTPVHFGSDPIHRVPIDNHVSTGHFGTKMHARIAFDSDGALVESNGDPFDSMAISAPDQCVVILGRAISVKERTERFSDVAMQDGDGEDLFVGLAADVGEPHGIDFDRNVGVVSECECQRHGGIEAEGRGGEST